MRHLTHGCYLQARCRMAGSGCMCKCDLACMCRYVETSDNYHYVKHPVCLHINGNIVIPVRQAAAFLSLTLLLPPSGTWPILFSAHEQRAALWRGANIRACARHGEELPSHGRWRSG